MLLFGSRVHDSRPGGDIDMLVEPPVPLPAADVVAGRSRFVARPCRLLDGRRIDVVVTDAVGDDDRPVVAAARRDGVVLAVA